MKILVIFTGGTIGSAEKASVIKLENSTDYTLLNEYRKRSKDFDTVFEACSPCKFFSENLSAGRLNQILDAVADGVKGDFDGIILTHGTDTLAFTAAACAYAFASAEKPIAVVSSDYPLDDERANGVCNFEAGVRLIAENRRGVFVPYKNENEPTAEAHIATRLVRFSECSDSLQSLSGKTPAARDCIPNGRYSDLSGVLVCESMPALYEIGDVAGCKAVILKPYHSATVNTQDKEIIKLCERAKSKNIPVLLVNSRDGKNYESKTAFDKLGIKVLPRCAFSAIYVKCWLAASIGVPVGEFVEKEIYGEFC